MGNRKSRVDAAETLIVSNREREKRSEELRNDDDIKLIWCYEQLNASNEEMNKTKELWGRIGDYVCFHENQQTCIDYMNTIQEKRIIVISSGPSALEFVKKIHRLKQVDSIFIFSHSDLDRLDESVRLRYVKVIDIYTEIHLLREAIRKDINRIEKSLAEFSFYQKEKSFTDLTAESGSFLFFQLCKSALFSMEKTDESKQEMLSECRLYYHGVKEELDNIEEFNTK
ncbi:unnamed protein product, partial [Didymodactylos carnosus]